MTQPEGKEFTKAQALEAMREHYNLGREIRESERLRGRFGSIIKSYLSQIKEEFLKDEEWSLVARLHERQGLDEWDLTRAPESLVLWAAKQGLVKLDNKLFQALVGKFIEADDLKPFRMPGKPTTALIVEKKEAS